MYIKKVITTSLTVKQKQQNSDNVHTNVDTFVNVFFSLSRLKQLFQKKGSRVCKCVKASFVLWCVRGKQSFVETILVG